MGAALFFVRLHKPSLALALSFPSNPTSEFDSGAYPTSTMDGNLGILTEEVKERTLEEYLDSHPEDARALCALMKFKVQARKPSEAIAIVDRLIAIEPSDKGLPLLRAHLQRLGGDTETAKQMFEEMLQRDSLHEIVGVVTEVGAKVNKFRVGDKVGVGCMVGSSRSCGNCKQGFENHCPKVVLTYSSTNTDYGTRTYGGYSDHMVVNEAFVMSFPESLSMDRAAALLCTGITVYSPMKYFGLNETEKHLGVVGLGGLGHVIVKFGKAFGMRVTVISSSPSKEKEAIERLGADAFLLSDNQRVTRPRGGINELLRWLLVSFYKKLFYALRRIIGDSQFMILLQGRKVGPLPYQNGRGKRQRDL